MPPESRRIPGPRPKFRWGLCDRSGGEVCGCGCGGGCCGQWLRVGIPFGGLLRKKNTVDSTETNFIPMVENGVGCGAAIDKCSIRGAEVVEVKSVPIGHDLRMVARYRIVFNAEIVVLNAPHGGYFVREFVNARGVLGENDLKLCHVGILLCGAAGGNFFGKLGEKIGGIMGSRAGLGVILHAERGNGLVAQARNRAVIEIHMRDLHGVRKRIGVHRISMIL